MESDAAAVGIEVWAGLGSQIGEPHNPETFPISERSKFPLSETTFYYRKQVSTIGHLNCPSNSRWAAIVNRNQ